MHKAGYLLALCAGASAACGTDVAIAVSAAPADAGVTGPEKPPQCMSGNIKDRLHRSTVPLSEPVRYKRTQYFFGLPQDDRIALSMVNNNVGMLAWVNSAGDTVHVTPLAARPDSITRFGNDVLVEGTELSGLVALEDGFALLTRRLDRGEPIGEGMTPTQATYLVRWKGIDEVFAAPLTGTKSIVEAPDDLKHDYPNPISSINALSGRLAVYGSHFGAYFSVRNGLGDRYKHEDPSMTTHADKFVEIDENGKFVSGWRMGCRQSLGNRLVADASGFHAFCMSDGTILLPGVALVLGTRDAPRLAPETAPASGGYAGGNFGSAIKIPSGYLVAWASRGTGPFDLHEPAVIVLDNDRKVVVVRWPFLTTREPMRDAVNVHAAPYGDKVLLVWETIDSPTFRNGYSTGTYGGTHFQLVDAQGQKASEEETLLESVAPNGQDEIVQFPNGDLAWAYVPEPRDFQTALSSSRLPNLPPLYEIKLVRLTYCTPP
jgi:hypothetical protein